MRTVTATNQRSIRAVEQGIFAVAEYLEEREPSPPDGWPTVSPSIVLDALVEASLGSRVRAEAVAAGMAKLADARLLSMASVRRLGSRRWCTRVQQVLAAGRGFPFVRQKVGYLRRTMSHVGATLRPLRATLELRRAAVVRAQVIAIAHGLGPKQGSFFLRQVGHPDPVAVLDVHILAYMRLVGLCDDERPPSTLARYEDLETRLLDYAIGRGFPQRHLDKAIWVTMRAVRGTA